MSSLERGRWGSDLQTVAMNMWDREKRVTEITAHCSSTLADNNFTTLQDMCVCLSAYVHEAIYRKFKLNERKRRYTCISDLHTCWNFCATKDSSPCNSTLIRDRLHLEQEERATPRLQHRRQRDQEGRWSERTEVMEARLDRRSIHGEESVVFSGSIGVELDSEGSIVSACTEH